MVRTVVLVSVPESVMDRAARAFEGTHDFRAVRSVGTETKTTDGGSGAEVGDIALGVDAGVRAAAARYFDLFAAQGGEGFF